MTKEKKLLTRAKTPYRLTRDFRLCKSARYLANSCPQLKQTAEKELN